MPYLAPVLIDAEVAKILRISVEQFREIRPELEAAGFPQPLPPLDRWLRRQIERWLVDQADKDEWWGQLPSLPEPEDDG